MIYIVIPIYNEELNIVNLKNELTSFLFDEEFFIVFSDDGSTDNTKGEIEASFSLNEFIFLGDGLNRGPGSAFNTGFNWVLQNSKNDKEFH